MTGPLAGRVLRVAAAALSIGLLLAGPLAAPASADNLAVVIENPAEGAVYTGTNVVTVRGFVTAGLLSVDDVHVDIFRSGAPFASGPACQSCGQGGNVPFSADFTLNRNGSYTAQVTARGSLLGFTEGPASAERSFFVAIPPGSPSLTAERLSDNRVRVSWSAVSNTPDFVGYVVYRSVASGAWQAPFGGTRELSVIDDSAAQTGGQIQYRVAALREGAAPGSEYWLPAYSNIVTVDVPVPANPTPPPGPTDGNPGEVTTPTTAANAPQTPSAANVDLGALFDRPQSSNVPLPSTATLPSIPSSGVELPDAGFNATLPFPTDPGPPVDGRQPGRPSSAAATGEVEDGTGEGVSDSNRRALLVPVAAGSVLSLFALHLRWLSRRLEGPADGAFAPGDFEHADPGPDPGFEPDPHAREREPVAAGARGPRPGA